MKPLLRVLDAYCVIAYLEGEDGKNKMIEVIQAARNTGRDLLLSVVNWGEVYYIALRETGRKQAEKVSHVISTLPIQIIPADLELAKQAAEFKAKCRMSYADCFAAALARMRNAELVTGDQDFRQVENEVKVLWLHD